MCHEWWTRRPFDEAEEGRRIWEDFERTRPVGEPDMPADEPEVTLEEREAAPAPPR